MQPGESVHPRGRDVEAPADIQSRYVLPMSHQVFQGHVRQFSAVSKGQALYQRAPAEQGFYGTISDVEARREVHAL